MANYSIRPVPILKGEIEKPRMTYDAHFGEMQDVGVFVWYIEGARRRIMVDTGVAIESFRRRVGTASPVQTLDEGLAKLGLKPEDIDTVIITHLHFDHIELTRRFKNAEVLVQKKELEFARNPHPLRAHAYKSNLSFLEGADIRTLDGDADIVDGVRVLLTPGHSAANQSVAVETAAGLAIITGFCCVQENFNPPQELRERGPFIPPGVTLNAMQAYESAARVRELADIIIPNHALEFARVERIP